MTLAQLKSQVSRGYRSIHCFYLFIYLFIHSFYFCHTTHITNTTKNAGFPVKDKKMARKAKQNHEAYMKLGFLTKYKTE